MNTVLEEQRSAFAARMHEVCTDLGIPAGRGRQAALGKRFGVSPKAARKWLEGEGYPEMALAVRIANEAKVNLTWLLQHSGPKRGQFVDSRALVVSDVVHVLPLDDAQELVNFIEFKLAKASAVVASEQVQQYTRALESMIADRTRTEKR